MSRLKLLLAGAGFMAILLAPSVASADVSDFTVTDFTAGETLSRADPHGELHIVEKISVNFTDFNHGILRAIPASYHGYSVRLRINSVSSQSGAPAQYTTYGSNGNTVLKIGDPSRTVTGTQEYTIDYTLHNVISFYKDHDELYWNANGTQWQQDFAYVNVALQLPSDLKQTRNPVCYAGNYGDNNHECAISGNARGNLIVATAHVLTPGQTLTYVLGFQKGYFTPPPWYDKTWVKPALKFAIPFVAISTGSWLYWRRRGRDPKGTGVIVPQYEAPDALKPAEVGTIYDFKLDNTDITATIIDLAIRGYLTITETKQDKLLGKDKLSYSFKQVKTDLSGLNAYETQLMNGIFSHATADNVVDMSALKNSLYTTAKTISTTVESGLTTSGYFRSNPLNTGKVMMVVGAIVIFALLYVGAFLSIPVAVGVGLGCVVAIIFSTKMAARTAKGVATLEQVKGLKMFMEFTEKDRLAKLQSPNAPYAANAGEPTRTVDLFERLLPYAMVLGVEKQWGRQFEGLYTQPPGWYNGNWSTFNAYYLASSLSGSMNAAMSTAFTAPSSSSSSGFGGGGFSGGGGGGGGGGGW